MNISEPGATVITPMICAHYKKRNPVGAKVLPRSAVTTWPVMASNMPLHSPKARVSDFIYRRQPIIGHQAA